MLVLLHDQFTDRDKCLIDIEDRANQFGDGVYEVIRVYNRKLFLLDDHLKRLEYSLKEAKIGYDLNQFELKQKLIELAERNQVVDGAIYVQISRGAAPRSHPFPEKSNPTVIAYPIKASRPVKQQQNGVKAVLHEDIRWLRCDIKSLNLLGNVMAKQFALDHGAMEAIFYRNENHVTEGSSTNVFIVKDGQVITHPANHFILNGITRIFIQKLANQDNIQFTEKVFSTTDLLNADEVFISSTTSEIVPVINVGEHLIGSGEPGPVTNQLLSSFIKHVE